MKLQHRQQELPAFFKYNHDNPTTFCYHEFPRHFVFNKQTGKWTPRKKRGESIIGRVYTASPKDIERFCLRLLLHHVQGPTSYEDLKHVNGVLHTDFKSACIALHLLEDDTVWENTMREAGAISMPPQMRALFATICLYCDPVDPRKLWDDNKEQLIEDFARRHSPHQAEQMALRHVESLLQPEKTGAELGLPDIDPDDDLQEESEFDAERESTEAERCIRMLNDEQAALVDSVMADLEEIQKAYFLDGPG
jgi:hypothetical protein